MIRCAVNLPLLTSKTVRVVRCVARGQWHRETALGSGMFIATQHFFWEFPKTVHALRGGLVFDPALQVWARPPDPRGGAAPPLCFPGDEGLIASVLADRRREATATAAGSTALVPTGGPGGSVPLTRNCFGFVVNSRWNAGAPPTTANPQHWVVRVVGVGPGPTGAMARLQWWQETAPGSGVYGGTPRVVTEPVKAVHPLQVSLAPDGRSVQVTGPFDDKLAFSEPGGRPV